MLESATVAEDVKKGRIFSIKVRDAGRLQKGGIWNRTYNAKLMEGLKEKYIGKILYEKIKGKLMIFKGKPAILTVTYDGPEGRITASQSRSDCTGGTETADCGGTCKKTDDAYRKFAVSV